jgi:hypothetical protein
VPAEKVTEYCVAFPSDSHGSITVSHSPDGATITLDANGRVDVAVHQSDNSPVEVDPGAPRHDPA